ncbi:TPA: hypothetical protein ACFIYR_001657 [Neisseria gonorrhoeae]
MPTLYCCLNVVEIMSVADTVLLPPVELPFRDMADASFLLNRIRIPPNLTECKTAAGNGLYDTSTTGCCGRIIIFFHPS